MVMAIAVPIMIQNGLTNFVNLLDNIMVGRLGTEEMSGVSIVNQIIFVYNLCIFGGTAGVGIFTAQYFGQKNDEGIRSTFRYKIWLALIITVGAAFLLLFFGKQLILLYLMGENGGNENEKNSGSGFGSVHGAGIWDDVSSDYLIGSSGVYDPAGLCQYDA